MPQKTPIPGISGVTPAKPRSKRRTDSSVQPFWTSDIGKLSASLWLPGSQMTQRDHVLGKAWFSSTEQWDVNPHQCQWNSRLVDIILKSSDGGEAQVTAPSSESPLLEARRIRVYPANPKQGELLRKWFGTARWTYNQCLNLVKDKTCKSNKSGGLREAVVNDGNYKETNQSVLETPHVTLELVPIWI